MNENNIRRKAQLAREALAKLGQTVVDEIKKDVKIVEETAVKVEEKIEKVEEETIKAIESAMGDAPVESSPTPAPEAPAPEATPTADVPSEPKSQ